MKVPKNLKKQKSNSAPQYHLSCIGYTFYKTKLLESAYFLIHSKASPHLKFNTLDNGSEHVNNAVCEPLFFFLLNSQLHAIEDLSLLSVNRAELEKSC